MSKVNFNQAGYVGTAMSVRAAAAYDNGEMPFSKWTKKAIIEQINYMLANEKDILIQSFETETMDYRIKDYDKELARQAIEVVNQKLVKLSKEDLINTFLKYSGYHHTGAYARRTSFFAVDWGYVRKIFKLLELEEEFKEFYETRELEVDEHGHKGYKDFKYYLDNIVYNKNYWKD